MIGWHLEMNAKGGESMNRGEMAAAHQLPPSHTQPLPGTAIIIATATRTAVSQPEEIEHITPAIVLPASAPFTSSPLNSTFISTARPSGLVGGETIFSQQSRFPQGGFALIRYCIISGIMHET